MPNHIQNRLQIVGEEKEIKNLLTAIAGKTDDGKKVQMDFNKIKPMPKQLNIASCSTGSLAQLILFGEGEDKRLFSVEEAQRRFSNLDEKLQREGIELALQYHKNQKEFGSTDWYRWCIDNWGTKWNAYDQNDKRNTVDTIYFQTAWSSPIDLMKLLSSQFPNVKILLTYADEDSGSNTGKFEMQNGEILEWAQPESQSIEGYEIYFELHPDSKENYKLVEGKYEYVESD